MVTLQVRYKVSVATSNIPNAGTDAPLLVQVRLYWGDGTLPACAKFGSAQPVTQGHPCCWNVAVLFFPRSAAHSYLSLQ
jgi:hypothetical protein